jgi:hypothetical protein
MGRGDKQGLPALPYPCDNDHAWPSHDPCNNAMKMHAHVKSRSDGTMYLICTVACFCHGVGN